MPVASDDVVWLDVLPSMGKFRSTLQTEAGVASSSAGAKAGTSFTSNFAKHLKVAAVLGGALAVGGAVKFMQEATREASNLGESINAVNVTFGDNAKGILDLGKAAAESVGLSTSQFNGLAVQFSAFATTIAGKGGDVTETMKDLTVRGADFASVMNLDVNEAMGLFQSGLAGETEPLRKYGIDLSAAAVENYALANGIVKAGETMTEQQKVQARYGSLMEQTSKVQGDFTNTSDSLANSQRILGARWDDIQAKVGSKVIPTLERFSGWVLEEGLPALQKFGGWIQDKVLPAAQRLFEGVKTGAEVVLPALGAAFRTVSDAVMATVGFFRRHETAAKILMGVVGTVAAFIAAAWIAQAAVSAANSAKAVLSWFKVATASTTSATIQSRSTAQIVFGWIAASAAAALNGAKMVATMALTALKVVAGWVLMGTQSLIQGARMAAAFVLAMGPVGWVIALVAGLVIAIIANWDKVVAASRAAWDWFKRILSGAWTWVRDNVFAPMGRFVTVTVPGMFRSGVEFLGRQWERLRSIVSGPINWVRDSVLKPFVKFITETIPNGFRDGVAAAGRMWDSLKAKLKAPVQWVVDFVWNNGLRKLWNAINNLWGGDDLKVFTFSSGGTYTPPRGRPGVQEFASGGVLPGYTPGRDVHDFFSPTGGRLRLSGGEAIMRPEFTRAVGGAAGVALLNKLAMRQGSSSLAAAMAGGGVIGPTQRFARGGVVSMPGWLDDALGGFASFLPGGGILRNVVEALFDRVNSGDGWGGGMLGSGLFDMAKGVGSKLMAAAKSLFDSNPPDAGGGAATPNGVGGLGPAAARAHEFVRSFFGFNGTIGGYSYRTIAGTNVLSKHAMGKAIDVMTYANMALGQRIADFFAGPGRGSFGVDNVIWNRRIHSGSGWGPYYGVSPHTDHPHIDFFDQGGLWGSGRMGLNLTGGVERVLTPPQDDYFRRFVASTERGGATQHHYDVVAGPGADEIARAIETRQREREALQPAW